MDRRTPLTKRVAIYARVSTADKNQTVENQLRDLLAVAERQGWEVVATFTDEGISGVKGRDRRPGYDNLLKGVARKDFEQIMAWSVDRLGRSLPDLVAFLNDIQSKSVDLYLHQQGLDTATPSGRMMFQMLGVFAEFERAMIRERILAGLRRTTKKSGRKPMPDDRVEAIRRSLLDGQGIRATARLHRASPMTVTAIKRSMNTVEESRLESVAAC
jgi:DNA invertase Pin-like site-specific DNA recombinase